VTCISVNEEVVHGIPGDRVLAAGDLVSVDFGAIVDGWHGDGAITFGVGELSPADARLSDVTREAMWAGIGAAHLRGRVGDISHAVERRIREEPLTYGIVRDFTGHGIGSRRCTSHPTFPTTDARGAAPGSWRGWRWLSSLWSLWARRKG
jgi:methionyl aminopeptidase